MAKFLVIDIWGPLSSWGVLAVGDVRPSQAHPTRSALMGLLAGAMGIRRHERRRHTALDQGLGLAVLVRGRGRPLTDFHTVEIPRKSKNAHYHTRAEELKGLHEKDNPIVSQREYRLEGSYGAAFWKATKQGPSLQEIADALERPGFTPYLGRKSCPLGLPLRPRVVEAESIRAAFDQSPLPEWSESAKEILTPGQELFWEEGGPPAGVESVQQFMRWDRPVDRIHWLFDQRPESWAGLD